MLCPPRREVEVEVEVYIGGNEMSNCFEDANIREKKEVEDSVRGFLSYHIMRCKTSAPTLCETSAFFPMLEMSPVRVMIAEESFVHEWRRVSPGSKISAAS